MGINEKALHMLPHLKKPAGFAFVKAGGGGLALRPTHPKKILTNDLAEGKSSFNKRPLCGPPQTPPPHLRLSS